MPYNVNLSNLKKIDKIYNSFLPKEKPLYWVKFCVERVIAYVEVLNERQ